MISRAAYDAPQVRGRVVAERREPPLDVGVVRRRRVEVHAGVGRRVLAVGAEDPLQVADPHVVRDEGEVLAAELLARDRQVAGAARERLDRVEALVGPRPGAPQALRLGRVPGALRALDAAPEAAAARHVDPHPEQALAGLGEDLGEADRALEVPGLRVRPARALEEHETPPAGPGRRVRWPRPAPPAAATRATRAAVRRRAARRAGVEHVAGAGGGAAHEVRLARRLVGERDRARPPGPIPARSARAARPAPDRRRAAPPRRARRRARARPRAARRGRARRSGSGGARAPGWHTGSASVRRIG